LDRFHTELQMVRNAGGQLVMTGPCSRLRLFQANLDRELRTRADRIDLSQRPEPVQVVVVDANTCQLFLDGSQEGLLESVNDSASKSLPPWFVERVKDQLFLYGPSCDLVAGEVRELVQFAKVFGESTSADVGSAIQTRSGCRVNVTRAVPRFVRQVHGFGKFGDGVDCHGIALFTVGQLGGTSLLAGMDLETNPFCGETAKPQPGSVGQYISNDSGKKSFPHSFVYISRNLVWEKASHSMPAVHKWFIRMWKVGSTWRRVTF
jgi:hypothetical protein